MTELNNEADVERFMDSVSRPWYRFGWNSPVVLFKRLLNGHPVFIHPLHTARMKWQRARRGWSDEDTWGFNYHLAHVIGGGVRHMRSIAHGHPAEITFEEWKAILDEIAEGMDAALVMLDEYAWPEGGEEKFNLAMDHLKKWFAALWD